MNNSNATVMSSQTRPIIQASPPDAGGQVEMNSHMSAPMSTAPVAVES
ncbi:MAG TPA: hypothetical protein VMJ66_06525 [Geobacteraceae bacterium]|nr:hypothetical protein [Geobacteraceae bacterium]